MAKQPKKRLPKRESTQQPAKPRPESKFTQSVSHRLSQHPVRWAVLGYALLTVVFFARPLVSFDKMLFQSDQMASGVFFKSFYADAWRTYGEMPLWEPYIHGGMPFVDAMHGDIFYPAALLQIIFPVTYALGFKLILHIFLAGVFMFLFLRMLKCSGGAAFIGGILYMFSPCLISLIYPGHDGKLYVSALTPLAFLALHRAVISRRLSAFCGFGLTYALLVLTAHVQMAYYASWGLGAYFIFLVIREYRTAPTRIALPAILFVASLLLAGGASAIQWLSPYKYLAEHSQRLRYDEEKGFEWASSWSMNAEEVGSLVIPEFSGDNVQGQLTTYWGQNFFKLNSEAVGALTLALALLTFLVWRSSTVWFFAGLSAVALIYAVGDSTPIFSLFYYLVPGVKKFRAPSMINFLFAFSWVVLASFAIDRILHAAESVKERVRKSGPDPWQVFAIITGAYALITLIVTVAGESVMSLWANIFGDGLEGAKAAAAAANAGRLASGAWISTVALTIVLVVWRALKKGSLLPLRAAAIIAAVGAVSLWFFDSRFIELEDTARYDRRPIIDKLDELGGDQPYRVLIAPKTMEDNYLALHGIEELSFSAMHGNHLLTYDEFVGRHSSNPTLANPRFLDLLNAKFMVAVQPGSNPPFERVGGADGLQIHENTGAFPRACGFYGYEVIADTGQTLARLQSPTFDYRRRLILPVEIPQLKSASSVRDTFPTFTAGRVLNRRINSFDAEIEMAEPGLLFLSENYYPAWHATENGAELPIYRADLTFRAVPLSAGRHVVHFEFHNPTFSKAVWITLVCLLVLLAGFATRWLVGRKSLPPAPPAAAPVTP